MTSATHQKNAVTNRNRTLRSTGFFLLFSQNLRTKISKLKPIYGKTQGFYLVTMTSSKVKIDQNSRIYGKTQGFYKVTMTSSSLKFDQMDFSELMLL